MESNQFTVLSVESVEILEQQNNLSKDANAFASQSLF